MPVLEKDDIKIPYDTWGESGPWITLVSPYTRPRQDYKAMARFLSERGLRVLAFDNRGAGEAECPPVFEIDDLAGDISELWGHLKIDASHLFGIGLGAAIALQAAASFPERVTSLVVASPPRTGADLTVEAKGPSRHPRRLELELMRYFSPEFVKANRAVVAGYMRQMGRLFQEPDTALGARAQRGVMEDLDLTPLLERVTCPTLVLQGEQDHIVPAESGKAIAAALPRAELRTFPGVGHLLLAEMPLALYESVEKFCRNPSNAR